MKKSIYKYINLLFRFAIGVLAVWFIYIKLKEDIIDKGDLIRIADINITLIIFTVLLLFVNWGLEALKWRFANRRIDSMSILKAYKLIKLIKFIKLKAY